MTWVCIFPFSHLHIRISEHLSLVWFQPSSLIFISDAVKYALSRCLLRKKIESYGMFSNRIGRKLICIPGLIGAMQQSLVFRAVTPTPMSTCTQPDNGFDTGYNVYWLSASSVVVVVVDIMLGTIVARFRIPNALLYKCHILENVRLLYIYIYIVYIYSLYI